MLKVQSNMGEAEWKERDGEFSVSEDTMNGSLVVRQGPTTTVYNARAWFGYDIFEEDE